MDAYLDVTHIALRLAGDLQSAEEFYSSLFELRVSWREPAPDGETFDLSWDALRRQGIEPEISMLHSGSFRLSIEAGSGSRPTSTPIDHVGLQVSAEQFRAIQERVRLLGFRVVAQREDELLDFIDSYGVEWELDTRSFSDPRAIIEAKRARLAAQ